MRRHDLAFALVAALAAAGCHSSAPANAPTEAASPRALTREAAIASARQDAYMRFGEVAPSAVQAERRGEFWVVELRRSDGAAVSYAISAEDGSIRQRSTIQ